MGGDWSVRRLGSEVVITPAYGPLLPQVSPLPTALATRFKDADGALAIDGGWLVSMDKGEWGGGLWWAGKDGTEDYGILDENVASVVQLGEVTVAVTGLAHGTSDQGAVVELVRDAAAPHRWREHRRVALSGAPRAWLVEGDAVLIATQTGVVRYRAGEVEPVIRAELDSLDANSIARDDTGAIYVGMRFAVVRSGPGGAAPATWLYPPVLPDASGRWR